MAGLTTALLLGGAALAGSVVNSKATKDAAKTTTNAARDASAAATATADRNNALLGSIYEQNKSALAPLIGQQGAASDAINAFLGLPTYKTEQTPDYEKYVDSNPDILATYDQYGKDFGSKGAFGEWYANNPELGGLNKRDVPTDPTQVIDQDANARAAQGLENFRNSTGYQDQMAQGVAALDQSATSRGLLKSGKAIKDATKYGQGLANQSTGQYLNYLSGQQSVGANAINALTGVGNAYATNVGANNTNATNTTNNLLTNAANTSAQAGLAGANNISNLLGQAVSAYGNYAGTSSYGGAGKTAQYGVPTPSYGATDPGWGLNTGYA